MLYLIKCNRSGKILWKPGYTGEDLKSNINRFRLYTSSDELVSLREGTLEDETKIQLCFGLYLNLEEGKEYYAERGEETVDPVSLFESPWKDIDQILIDNYDSIIRNIRDKRLKNMLYTKLISMKEEDITQSVGVDITPSIGFLDTIRNSGYDIKSAICDIIDNSLEEDVGSKNIGVYISLGSGKTIREISISDDGSGMDWDTVISAFTLGKSGREKSKNLGCYGAGLKAAGTFLGNTIKILTKREEGRMIIAEYDIDYMKSINKFSLKTMRYATKIEEEGFTNEIGTTHGTKVVINNSSRPCNSLPTLLSKLRIDLGLCFRYFIINKGVSITLNDFKVAPIDPLYREIPGVITLTKPDSIIYFNGSIIRFQVTYLPKDIGGIDIQRNLVNSGLYFYRNDRLVGKGLGLGILKKHSNKGNGTRIEIRFSGDLDEYLGSSFLKSVYEKDIDPNLLEALKTALDPFIKDSYKRNKDDILGKTEDRIKKNIMGVIKKINNNQFIGNGENKDVLGVDFVSKGEYGKVYYSSIEEGKIKISFNTDHRFWTNLLSTCPLEELEHFVLLFGAEEISKTESRYHDKDILDNIFNEFSKNISNNIANLIKG